MISMTKRKVDLRVNGFTHDLLVEATGMAVIPEVRPGND